MKTAFAAHPLRTRWPSAQGWSTIPLMADDFDLIWTEPVPVFPLPNCVMLTGPVLPLHVFEPRYRTMIREVLARRPGQRVLAIALLRDGYEDQYLTNFAPIHPVVGVGAVVEHQELPDGRFNLLLQGRARAMIQVEDTSGPYRRAMLVPRESVPFDSLDAEASARDSLCALLEDAAAVNLWATKATEQLCHAYPRTEQLIDVLAFHVIPDDEILVKQQILEEACIATRLAVVQSWLQRAVAAKRYAECRPQHGPWPPSQSQN
ncbi:MAG TPA: LON peptidase substrate-binding domain-containing protein [Phycisphaerae bacterium]|nr:LON peptidase substrate-binding domain-containing protein [Phycisphaerae bacterium]